VLFYLGNFFIGLPGYEREMQIRKSLIPVPGETNPTPQARKGRKGLVVGMKGSFSDQNILSFQASRGSRITR
jgi:hypothetical protein